MFNSPERQTKKLFKAINNWELDTVKKALDNGADINAFNKYGLTPLMQACKHAPHPIVKELIAHDADISITSKPSGYTALDFAIDRNHTSSISELIINGGDDINKKNRNGTTPLNCAAYRGDADLANLLIRKGAKIDEQDNSGCSAIISAAKKGHSHIVKILIEAGANLEIEDNNGYTALMCAQKELHLGVVKTIEEHMGKNKKPQAALVTDKASEKWIKTGDFSISFVGVYPEIEERITKTFNLATRQQIITVKDLSTNTTASPLAVSFNDLDKKVLENVLKEFSAQGGKANDDFVINGDNSIKKAATKTSPNLTS